jgi:phage baseplate assembly protein W
MMRTDVAFPFRIAAGSGQGAHVTYQDHVDQLIRQVLLTDPGERVNLPRFGAGMRRLLFAPMSSSLATTTKLIVTQALAQWIPTQIVVQDVTVVTSDKDASIPEGAIVVTITYQLVETRAPRQTVVTVLP